MREEEFKKITRKIKTKLWKKRLYYVSFLCILNPFIEIFNWERFLDSFNREKVQLLTSKDVFLQIKFTIFVMLIIFLINFIRKIRVVFIKNTNEFSRVMPDNHTPLEVSYLMNGCYNKQSFTIALLELIRKNYFKIQFATNHDVFFTGGELLNVRNTNLPVDYNYYLSTELWKKFKYFDKLYLKDLNAKRNRKALNEIFESWTAMNYKVGILELYLSDNYISKSIFNVIIGMWIRIITISPINLYIYEGIIMLFIILLYIYTNHSKIYTKDGAKKLKEWTLYKNYLEQFSNLKDRKLEEVMLWEDYLLYAVALNINVDCLQQNFKTLHISDYHFAQSLPGEQINDD